jgi:hypothetical protein
MISLAGILMAEAAHAQSALSQNAAGFIRLDVEDSSLYQITVPLVTLGSPLLPESVFGNLPDGSTIIFWDDTEQAYKQGAANETKLLGSWTPNTNDLYQKSFWLYVGETSSPSSFTSLIYGRVPDGQTMPTQNVTLVSDANTNIVNLIGYAYPVDINWTNSTLAQSAANSSYLLLPDEQQPGFIKITKDGGNWSPNVVIQAGKSFWYYAAPGSSNTWQETKPYDYP